MLTTAERARTTLAGASSVVLRWGTWRCEIARHALDADGSVLMPLSSLPGGAAWPMHATPVPVTLSATDVCAVPQPDRVRGQVTLVGDAAPVRAGLPDGVLEYLTEAAPAGERGGSPATVVRLTPTAVDLDWRCEGGSWESAIPLRDYRAARLDPLVGWENGWLEQLGRDHGALLHQVTSRLALEAGVVLDSCAVVPVLADRHGVVVRQYRDSGITDLRIPFPWVVSCGCDAVAAFNALVSAVVDAE